MSKPRIKKEMVGIVAIIGIVMAILLFTIFLRTYQATRQTTKQASSPTQVPLLFDTLSTKAVSPAAQQYSGKFFTVIFPQKTWKISTAFDCGEDDKERVAIYPTDKAIYNADVPESVINICVQPLDKNEVSSYYSSEDAILQGQAQNHLLNSFEQIEFLGRKAFTYELTRSDFPGHYEKTIAFLEKNNGYRVSWSIQTDSLEKEESVKSQTQHDYETIIASISFK